MVGHRHRGFPPPMTPSVASMERPAIPASGALTGVLDQRAAHDPDLLAYRFLPDGEDKELTLSLGELARDARAVAAGLVGEGASGKPVLLMEPPGLGFVTGLFACWYAGAIAVPAYPPRGNRHKQRLDAPLRDDLHYELQLRRLVVMMPHRATISTTFQRTTGVRVIAS